jgi:pyridoxine 5-phosphate synthase
VSLYVNPIDGQIETAKAIGTDMVEIHTGEYAEARSRQEQQAQLKRIQRAAKLAKSINLGVNAGHGLDYSNVTSIAAVKEIDELSIGHAIITRSLFVGLDRAVRDMLRLMRKSR